MNTLTNLDSGNFNFQAYSITDLWRRRTALNETEIVQIYNLVYHALRGYYPSELRSLPEDKEELIAQFFYSRVMRFDLELRDSNDSANSAPSSAYALCTYFRRFLIDCLRRPSLQRNLSIEVDGVQAQVDSRAHAPDDPIAAALLEYGLDEPRVRELARAFVAGLDEHDCIILRASLEAAHQCKGGLKAAAEANGVRSYHYRACKLGVSRKKTARPEDFAATKIGRWITSTLGIAIAPENREAILATLDLLALEAHG